ncbi:MAG: hypothetical protein PHI18_05310 [bacterium]|nr:hypothetical protein [bacterium]
MLCEAWSEETGRIDTAWLAYRDFPAVGMRLSMQNVWSASLTASYFGDPQLGSVVGQPFRFVLDVTADSLYAIEPVYLFRVIEQTPALISPRNSETTGPLPILRWEHFAANFPFHFRVTVVLRAGEYEAIIWQRDEVSEDALQIAVEDSLDDGSYYWTLHVVDAFENTSRSKEGLFVVQGEGNP